MVDNIICAICHENLQESSEIVSMVPCGHVYHSPYLMRWLQNNPQCPGCRRFATSNNILRLYMNFEEDESVKSKIASLESQIKSKQAALKRSSDENIELKLQKQQLGLKVENAEKTLKEKDSLIFNLTKEKRELSNKNFTLCEKIKVLENIAYTSNLVINSHIELVLVALMKSTDESIELKISNQHIDFKVESVDKTLSKNVSLIQDMAKDICDLLRQNRELSEKIKNLEKTAADSNFVIDSLKKCNTLLTDQNKAQLDFFGEKETHMNRQIQTLTTAIQNNEKAKTQNNPSTQLSNTSLVPSGPFAQPLTSSPQKSQDVTKTLETTVAPTFQFQSKPIFSFGTSKTTTKAKNNTKNGFRFVFPNLTPKPENRNLVSTMDETKSSESLDKTIQIPKSSPFLFEISNDASPILSFGASKTSSEETNNATIFPKSTPNLQKPNFVFNKDCTESPNLPKATFDVPKSSSIFRFESSKDSSIFSSGSRRPVKNTTLPTSLKTEKMKILNRKHLTKILVFLTSYQCQTLQIH